MSVRTWMTVDWVEWEPIHANDCPRPPVLSGGWGQSIVCPACGCHSQSPTVSVVKASEYWAVSEQREGFMRVAGERGRMLYRVRDVLDGKKKYASLVAEIEVALGVERE